MTKHTPPLPVGQAELTFVYKRDGFSIPIRAVYESLTPIEKEAFDAYVAAQATAAQERAVLRAALEARIDELQTVAKDNKTTELVCKYNDGSAAPIFVRIEQLSAVLAAQPKEGKQL
jgi:hypothetical protein